MAQIRNTKLGFLLGMQTYHFILCSLVKFRIIERLTKFIINKGIVFFDNKKKTNIANVMHSLKLLLQIPNYLCESNALGGCFCLSIKYISHMPFTELFCGFDKSLWIDVY